LVPTVIKTQSDEFRMNAVCILQENARIAKQDVGGIQTPILAGVLMQFAPQTSGGQTNSDLRSNRAIIQLMT
jgi:hypothetical protein